MSAAERIGGERRFHGIRCRRWGGGGGGGTLGDHVTDVVDDIGVVAGAADQGVGACAAVQRVVGGAAGDDVVQRVAGAREGAGAR